MMSLSDLLREWFSVPPPQPPPSHDLPDESDIRWEKALLNARLRRARELQIDVDIENERKNDTNS